MIIYYIDSIGFYGPVIIGIIDLFALWFCKLYLFSYIICFIVNTMINGIIKSVVKESRPTEQIYLNKYDVTPDTIPSKYGMPSGHAQSVAFSITYTYLVIHSPAILIINSFIGVLTIYQRYKYRRHTISQLIIGLITGSIVAMLSYETAKIMITQPSIKM